MKFPEPKIWIDAIVAVALVDLISLSGALLLTINPMKLRKHLRLLVSFAVDALLGDALIRS